MIEDNSAKLTQVETESRQNLPSNPTQTITISPCHRWNGWNNPILDAFMKKHGVKLAKHFGCPLMLLGKRCRNYQTCYREHFPPGHDHEFRFIKDGKTHFWTWQPYVYVRDRIQPWADQWGFEVDLRPSTESWWNPGNTLLLVARLKEAREPRPILDCAEVKILEEKVKDKSNETN